VTAEGRPIRDGGVARAEHPRGALHPPEKALFLFLYCYLRMLVDALCCCCARGANTSGSEVCARRPNTRDTRQGLVPSRWIMPASARGVCRPNPNLTGPRPNGFFCQKVGAPRTQKDRTQPASAGTVIALLQAASCSCEVASSKRMILETPRKFENLFLDARHRQIIAQKVYLPV